MTQSPASNHLWYCIAVVAWCAAAAAACKQAQDIVVTAVLAVTPDSLADSVSVGSTAPRAMTIHTMNLGGGELRWHAQVAGRSPWLSVQSDSGLAGDSVLVWANPTGLAVGVYRDTILVTADLGGSERVPVVFRTLSLSLPPPSTARRLAFTAEPSSAAAGSIPLVQVAVLDSAGSIVTSFAGAISLMALSDTGPLSGTTTVSAVAGIATFSNFGLVKTGCRRLVASSPGLQPDTSAVICITPGPAAALAFVVQPASSAASCSATGTVILPVAVAVVDAYGNTVNSATDPIHITLSSAAGVGATLSGITTISAVAGVATFSDLSIDKTGPGYSLVATATGLTDATSDAFTVPPDACWYHLVFTVQPSSAAVGAVITPSVQLCAMDGFGNVAVWFTGDLTIALANNPGGGTLSGTLTRAAVNGCATFSDLSINKAGAAYTIQALHASFVSTTSAPFNIGP